MFVYVKVKKKSVSELNKKKASLRILFITVPPAAVLLPPPGPGKITLFIYTLELD